MSKIALTTNASGSGTFTIASPNSNTDRTLTLPDEAGTVLTSTSDINSAKVKPAAINYWPAFLASGSNSGAWRAYNSGEILQFNDVTTGNFLFNNGNDFNTSTYTYTCPVSGLYSFSMQVYTLLNETEGNGVFYVNNARVEGASSLHVQTREDASLDMTGNQTIVLSLSATDTVQVRTNNAASFFIHHSFFTGHLIAAT